MDAGEALHELTRLSADVESAVVVDSSGVIRASTSGADADRLARTADELLELAAPVRPGGSVARVEVDLARGSVFVIRAEGLVAIATTRPEPVAALVVHDLLKCLERIAASPRPKGRGRREPDPVDA